MALSINSNIAAMRALRVLASEQDGLGRSFLRLSSGLRINRAADDAAGLAIASTLSTQRRVMSRALGNVNDAVSFLNTAQGSAEQLSSIVVRIKELAQQSANGSLSSGQRSSLNAEAQSLRNEYNRLISATRFNGLTIHAANQAQTQIQAGFGSGAVLGFDLAEALERTVTDGSFATGSSLNVGVGITDAVVGDFNRDGYLDVIGIVDGSTKMKYLRGKGDGTFQLVADISASTTVSAITTADFDNDGDLDIVVGTTGGNGLYFNNTHGNFAETIGFAINQGADKVEDLEAADMDNDGNVDLVSTYNSSGLGGLIKVHLGTGAGAFKAGIVSGGVSGVRSTSLEVADFDGDGYKDVAVNTAANGNIYLAKNNKSGTGFTYSAIVTGLGGVGSQIVVGDQNGDGKLDIIANRQGTGVATILGNGNGTFVASKTTSIAGNSHQVEDLNGDGFDDLVVTVGSNQTVQTYLSNGDGTYQSAITSKSSGSGATLNSLLLADFDGDGDIDAFAAGSSHANFLLGNSTKVTTLDSLDISTSAGALEALEAMETQLDRISRELGLIGSAMSRLESVTRTLWATSENYASAESRITDVDVASETASLVRRQILRETSTAVLAQANQIPAITLQLLNF